MSEEKDEKEEEKNKKVSMPAIKGIGIIFLLIVIVWAITTTINVRAGGGKAKSKLEHLEVLYQEKNYEAIDQELENVKYKYADTYRKYYNSVGVYKGIKKADSYIKEIKEFAVDDEKFQDEEEKKDAIAEDLYKIYDELYDIKKLEDKNFPHGEGSAVLEMKDELTNSLEDELKLTKAEIRKGTKNFYKLEAEDFKKTAESIILRLNK